MVARALTGAALLGLALVAGCGGERSGGPTPTAAVPIDGAVTIRASEWRFEPSRTMIPKGEPVRIAFQNEGTILHDLKIEGLEASEVQSESNGPLSGGDGDLFVGANAGKSGTLRLTPNAAGTFPYYCTLPQHRQLGMRGTLTVE